MSKGNKIAIVLLGLLIVIFILFQLAWSVPGLLHTGGPQETETCTMPAGMTCAKTVLSSDGGILQLTLANNLPKSIVVTSITCTKKPDQFVRLLNTTMESGQAYAFLLNCNGENGELLEFAPGDAFSGKINVEYYFADEGPINPRKLSGNIYVKAG